VASLPLQQILTLAIFASAYVGLGLGRLPGFRVDRTGVAIIGAAAMVAAGAAARSARIDIGFLEYGKVGVPLTVVTLAIGWLVLVLRPI